MKNKDCKIPNIEVLENSLAIIGWEEGTAGQIHSWLEETSEYHIACFINPSDQPLNINVGGIHRDATQFSYPTKDGFKNKPLINASKWYDVVSDLKINKVLVTTGDPYQRYEEINHANEHNIDLINAFHPTSIIMEDAIIKANVILHAKTFVGYRAEIFSGSIIDSGSQIDHHCVLGKCVKIDPGVILAGNVTVGDFTTIHTGSVIKNRIRIGEDSIIGAGSVIIEDVPSSVTVVGVPGKIIKRH